MGETVDVLVVGAFVFPYGIEAFRLTMISIQADRMDPVDVGEVFQR